MILKAWVKFTEDMDVECMCTEIQCKDCPHNYNCDPYVVKFVPIEETGVGDTDSSFNNSLKQLNRELKKTTREVEKINKVNKKFIR